MSHDELDKPHDELDKLHDESDELHGLVIVTDPHELDKFDTDELQDNDTVQLIVSLLLLEGASEFNPVTDNNEHEL